MKSLSFFKKALLLSAAILIILMLAFPLAVYTDVCYEEYGHSFPRRFIVIGYAAMFDIGDSSYILYYTWQKMVVGILCWLFFATAVIFFVMLFVAHIKRRNISNACVVVSMAVTTLCTLLYMITGIVMISILGDGYSLAFLPFILSIFIIVAYIILAASVKSSDDTGGAITENGYFSIGAHIACIILIPFWIFVWIYSTTRFLNCVKSKPERNPAKKVLLCIFVPFYIVYWMYMSGVYTDELAKSRGVSSDLAILCLILSFFIPIIPAILIQSKINESETIARTELNSQSTYAQPRFTESLDNQQKNESVLKAEQIAEQLKTYKELLDIGAITQEEYDKKKAAILNNEA